MIESYIIYGFLGSSLFLLGYIARLREANDLLHNKKSSLFHYDIVIILGVFSLISGVRWNVGIDYPVYLANYLHYQDTGYNLVEFEFGFAWITNFLSALGLHYSIYFSLLAFIQLFLVIYTVKNQIYLLPFLLIAIICGPHYLSWMNGTRQIIAACIFAYSTRYILDRRFFSFIICILIAYAFHKSAIILIPLYFINKVKIVENKVFCISIIVLSFYVGHSSFPDHLEGLFQNIFSMLGYTKYSMGVEDLISSTHQRSFGPRSAILLTLCLITIYYYDRLCLYYNDTGFRYYYFLMIIGVIYGNVFVSSNHLFLRPVSYLTIFSIFTTAFLLDYLKSFHKNIVVYLIVLSLVISYMPLTIYSDSNGSFMDFTSYQFFWDQ